MLQNSLSGNSKTLMFLNLSPLATHLNESLCSLRFATKVCILIYSPTVPNYVLKSPNFQVNNTAIGTAKKQTAKHASS